MQPYEYETMHRYEDHYWWYTGLRRLLTLAVKNCFTASPETVLLDTGCGTGGNLAHVAKLLNPAKLFAMDIYSPALHLTHARKTGAVLLQASVNQIPFRENVFHVVTCLDVLYIRGIDEVKSFQELYRILKPGGFLFVNLPAYEFLRGEHDIAVHTCHRYTAFELGRKLKSAGFSIKHLTYWNASLLPFLLIWRKIKFWKKNSGDPKSDLKPIPVWINEVLKIVLKVEEMFISVLNLPFGTSVFAVAQKPS